MTSTPTRRGRIRPRLLAALAVTGCVGLAACGPPPASGGGDAGRAAVGEPPPELPACPLDALAAAEGPVEVNLWYGGIVEPPVGVLNELIAGFNASQDQIVVTGDDQGTSYDEVLRQYERTAATPDQLPDIIYMEDSALGQLVDRGQLLPAQSCMEADGYDPANLVPAARAAAEVDGVLYPGYMNVSSPILYYNKVHFQAAGLDPDDPPGTLAELEEAARRIRPAGVAPRPLSFVTSQWFFQTWIGGLGQDMVNNGNGRDEPATEALLDTPETRSLMQWLADMNAEQLLNPFPVTDGSIDHYLASSPSRARCSSRRRRRRAPSPRRSAAASRPSRRAPTSTWRCSRRRTSSPARRGSPAWRSPGRWPRRAATSTSSTSGRRRSRRRRGGSCGTCSSRRTRSGGTSTGGYLPVVQGVLDDPDVVEFRSTDLGGLLLAPVGRADRGGRPGGRRPLIGRSRPTRTSCRARWRTSCSAAATRRLRSPRPTRPWTAPSRSTTADGPRTAGIPPHGRPRPDRRESMDLTYRVHFDHTAAGDFGPEHPCVEDARRWAAETAPGRRYRIAEIGDEDGAGKLVE
jgi:hypothetical protein